jgi:hypothetical protein
MKREKFNTILNDLSESSDIKQLVLEDIGEVTEISKPTFNPELEAKPNELTLDSIIYISQELSSGNIRKYTFVVCEVWLKPKNIWTIVNIKKTKSEENFWILFYDNGTYYLKKGIKGPIGVHVEVKQV